MGFQPENSLLTQTDRVVCNCYQVEESTIREAIDVYGASTVAEITEQTCAGGGCTACHCRLRRMLAGKPAMCSPFTVCNECGFNSVVCECRVA